MGTCVCERDSVLEGPWQVMLGKGPRKERARFSTWVETCREENAREGTKEGTCSPFDAGGNECWEKVFANVSAGADTKPNALGAGGALELLEHTATRRSSRLERTTTTGDWALGRRLAAGPEEPDAWLGATLAAPQPIGPRRPKLSWLRGAQAAAHWGRAEAQRHARDAARRRLPALPGQQQTTTRAWRSPSRRG